MSLHTIKNMIMVLVITTSALNAQELTLSLKKTISIAKHNDLWLVESYYSQKSVESLSIAAGSLPDPKVSFTFLNYPTDNFEFGQEPMTQIKVGVSQMFPRGKTLQLKKQQLSIKSEIYPFQRLDRSAKVEVMVTQLWLDAYKAQQSVFLIEQNRSLFEQLAEVAQSNYSSAFGKTQQQDIIRAQLELTRLEDRLTQLQQKYDTSMQTLSQWLTDRFTKGYGDLDVVEGIVVTNQLVLDKSMPEIVLKQTVNLSSDEMTSVLNNHPAVVAIQQKIKASETGIDLANQKYKLAWGVNASYGYRGDSPMGINRSDFLTLGFSFDVPLFTKNRQDKQVESAVAINNATQSQIYQTLKKMLASYKSASAQLRQLDNRKDLFANKLLPQMHEQAEASLTAYTNDNGDFAEVVRARIAELNAKIDALSIAVDRLKVIAQINYFFAKV